MVFARIRSGDKRSESDDWPISMRGWRRWLDTADRLDNRELAHRIHQAVRVLNRRELSARERIRVLEYLDPGIRRALDYLSNRVQAQPLPLPAPALAAYRIILDLLDELARAFESVVLDNSRRPNRRMAARASERALAFHGERALRVLQTYSALDADFWPRVNRIYRAAERTGIAHTSVATAGRSPGKRDRQSPAAMYKRLLLFTLAGTHGARRDETARLYRALRSWSDLAELSAPRQETDGSLPRFAIDIDSELGPVAIDGSESGTSIRILDVHELVIHIEQLRVQSDPQHKALPADDEVGHGTLVRLLDNWMPGNYQRSHRARRGSEVDAEVALKVIHARITGENRPSSQADNKQPEPPPDWELEPIAESDMALSRDAGSIRPGVNWNEIPQGRDYSPGHEEARAVESATHGSSAERLQPRWILEDVSATGFRLIWEGRGSCRVAVGEVIALRTTDNDEGRSRWCAGIVRRMRFLDEHRFEIGVEALVRNALAVRLDRLPANPNVKRGEAQANDGPALLLPADRGAGHPATLLVPAHAHRQGDPVEVDMRGRKSRFTLGTLVEDTGTVSRYELTRAPDRGRHAPSDSRFAESL